MKTAALIEDFDGAFELIPSTGDSNTFVIHSKGKPLPPKEKMTDEDWNKFEKDITDAFEKIP